MSNRHLARMIAMQALYQWDFTGQPQEKIDEIISFVRREFAPNFEDGGFIESLVKGVIEKITEINQLVGQFAPNWPLESITIIDRNILRLGIFELKFSPAVPSKVAINEAIELAKSFGGEASGKFVNGVLGAIYKEMVEAGQLKEVDKEEKKT